MRIKSLKLQHIRSYIEETIQFSEGSQLLAGDIGAGKSTILLAIEYALFGTKRGELETTSLLRNGSHAGRIELTFELHGKEITVSRTLKRTTQSVKQEAGYLTINSSRVDATPVELRSRIIELLGYPKEAQSIAKDLIYRYTVFTPQENMRQIIYDDKETRLNTLRKVFNIDKYKKVKENAQFIAKELRAQKRALEETITDIPTLEEKKKKLTEEKEKKSQEYALHKEKVDLLQKERSKREQELSVLETRSRDYQEKKERYASFKAQQQAKQGFLEQIKKKEKELLGLIELLKRAQAPSPVRPTEKPLHTLEQEKEQLEKEITEMQQQLALLEQQENISSLQQQNLSQEIKNIEQAVLYKQEYEQQFLALEREIAKRETAEKALHLLEQEHISLQREETTADVSRKNAEAIIDRMPLLQNCTLCLQDVTHEHKERMYTSHKKIVDDATLQLTALQTKKQALVIRIVEQKKIIQQILVAEKKKAVLQTMMKEIVLKENILKEKQLLMLALEKQRVQQEERRKELDAFPYEKKKQEILDLKKLVEEIRVWEKHVEEQKIHAQKVTEKEEQWRTIQQERAQTEKEVETISKEVTVLAPVLEQYAAHEQHLLLKKQTHETSCQQEKQEEIKYISLEKELFYLQEQLAQQEALLQEKYAVQQKVKKLQTYHQWLDDFFVPLVGTMEKHVLLQVHASFNTFFTKWFGMLIGEGLSARLDEEFTPVIEQNGYDTDVLDLSGGEKTAVALAYRLALNKVINDFISTIHTKDLLILDEPTDGFSTEQLDKMRDVLEELQIAQLIVVSHEAKIESFVDKIVRIEKLGHVSRVMVS